MNEITEILSDAKKAVTFKQEEHEYWLDGVRMPSVSELMEPVNRMVYGGWTRKTKAMDKGTAVHKAIESFEETGMADASEEIAPYMQAYMNWRNQVGPSMLSLANEQVVIGRGYCGTCDKIMYDTKFEQVYLVDIKTGKTPHPELWAIQMNLYRRALKFMGVDIAMCIVLHLKENGEWEEYVMEHQIDMSDYAVDALFVLNQWRLVNVQ